jgi:hypothetical protein
MLAPAWCLLPSLEEALSLINLQEKSAKQSKELILSADCLCLFNYTQFYMLGVAMARPVRLQVAQPGIRGSILCRSKILVFSTAT